MKNIGSYNTHSRIANLKAIQNDGDKSDSRIDGISIDMRGCNCCNKTSMVLRVYNLVELMEHALGPKIFESKELSSLAKVLEEIHELNHDPGECVTQLQLQMEIRR